MSATCLFITANRWIEVAPTRDISKTRGSRPVMILLRMDRFTKAFVTDIHIIPRHYVLPCYGGWMKKPLKVRADARRRRGLPTEKKSEVPRRKDAGPRRALNKDDAGSDKRHGAKFQRPA